MQRNAMLAVAVVVVLVTAGVVIVSIVLGAPRGAGCGRQLSSEGSAAGEAIPASRSTVGSRTFGSVVEYDLPKPDRWPNGMATAADGSVWFGEKTGVGHLFGNGTLVEYSYACIDGYSNVASGDELGVWGVTIWNGGVWAANMNLNLVVGLDPSSGTVRVIDTSQLIANPYLVAAYPGGSLWFTSLSGGKDFGKLDGGMNLARVGVDTVGNEEPIQMVFVNATTGYFVGLDPGSSTGEGHLYSFRVTTAGLISRVVHTSERIYSPDSLSVSGGVAWIAQHGPSSVVGVNLSSGEVTTYPTSSVGYIDTTLPYFIQTSGQTVWFNEHYGNRIAAVDPVQGTLTEFSEANPPVDNASLIQNDLTISTAPGGLWFTSATGNYVGFVNSKLEPDFTLRASEGNSETAHAGGNLTFSLTLDGHGREALALRATDSENFTGTPSFIQVSVTPGSVAEGWTGQVRVTVDLEVKEGASPGSYTVAVTAQDGLVSQTAYLFIKVT